MGRRSDHTRAELKQLVFDASRAIIGREGLKALSVRRVATAIGYSVGTIYQVYDNLDAIVLAVNASTLQSLYEECRSISQEGAAEEVLLRLAHSYLQFVERHTLLWNSLFEHVYPSNLARTKDYENALTSLLNLAVAPLTEVTNGNDERARLEARILWSSLYGIGSLASTNKMLESEPAVKLAASLLTTYLRGLRTEFVN